MSHTVFDWERGERTGVPETVFAASKTAQQLRDVIEEHVARETPLLMTPAKTFT